MTRKIYAFSLVVLLTALSACYPAGPEYVDELDIAYSNHDANYDFVSKGTYSLPDKVVKVTGDLTRPPEYIKDIYGVPILQRIDANMQALGWTKVAVGATPDLQLLPAAWESTTIIYGGYWGSYWCWYYPYYCGGGWYYPYTPVSTYSTGTLVMTLVDPNQATTDDTKRVTWTGAINGLLSGAYDATRVSNGIDKVFSQSPYLKTN
jgi:hypothetical protein